MASVFKLLRTCGLIVFVVLQVCALEESESAPWIVAIKVEEKICDLYSCKYLLKVHGGEFLGHYSWRLTPDEASRGGSCGALAPNYELSEVKTERWESVVEIVIPNAEGRIFFCLRHVEVKSSPFGGKWMHQGKDLFLEPKIDVTSLIRRLPKSSNQSAEPHNSTEVDLSHDTDVNRNAVTLSPHERNDIEIYYKDRYVPLNEIRDNFVQSETTLPGKGDGSDLTKDDKGSDDNNVINNSNSEINHLNLGETVVVDDFDDSNKNTFEVWNENADYRAKRNVFGDTKIVEDVKKKQDNKTDELITNHDVVKALKEQENAIKPVLYHENHEDALIKVRKEREVPSNVEIIDEISSKIKKNEMDSDIKTRKENHKAYFEESNKSLVPSNFKILKLQKPSEYIKAKEKVTSFDNEIVQKNQTPIDYELHDKQITANDKILKHLQTPPDIDQLDINQKTSNKQPSDINILESVTPSHLNTFESVTPSDLNTRESVTPSDLNTFESVTPLDLNILESVTPSDLTLEIQTRSDVLIRKTRQVTPSDFHSVKSMGNSVTVEGLRVEHSAKEPKITEDNVPSVLAGATVTLRIFGEGITERTVIAFTFNAQKFGEQCKFLLKGEYTVIPDSLKDSKTALFDVEAPSPVLGSKVYICAKNLKPGVTDPSIDEDKYIHQGADSFKILATHNKLLPLWVTLILILVCLMFSALFSGLNLGLMSLDRTELKIISNTGTEQERKYARAIMPVRDHGNYLLCSILLGNVAVNSTFTILLDELTSGLFAVIFSTLAIVLLGEITPQAICSRHGLMVGAKSIMITKAVMAITAPLAYPVSKLLDYFLGEEIGSVYNRERLKELVKVTTDVNDLDKDEVNIISGALELRKKTVSDVMTKLEDVFMLPISSVLDFETMSEIVKSGYSRIPVYEGSRGNIVTVLFIKDLAFVDPDDNTPLRTLCQYYQNACNFVFEDVTLDVMFKQFKEGYSRIPVYEGSRGNIVTVLFIKDLAFVDPDDNTPLRTLCQYYQNACNFVFEDVTLDVMFKQFKEGHKGHMAFVHRINNEGEGDPFYETIGLVTLEDVIEEMIQAEIIDETDVFMDNRTKRRRNRPQNKLHQDFTAFAERHENQRIHISPQLTLATFQFLSSMDNRTKRRRNRPQNKLHQDFTAFAERHENQRIHISPQLTLATFQFLSSSVDAFRPDTVSETVLRRLLKQDVIHHIKLKGKSKKDPSTYVFHQGKPVDYFILILEGRVEVTVGRENLVFEAGPFTYFGVQALTQNVGVAESPTPSAMGSLQNINMDSMLRHTFVPDYSVRAITELFYLTVKRSLYLAAKRATLMEKGALSKGGTNEQFDTEVDKLLQSVDEDISISGDHKTPSRQVSPNPAGVPGSPHPRASFASRASPEPRRSDAFTRADEQEKLLKSP